MLGYLMEPHWSPYMAGFGIGILVCLAPLLSDRPLGCSTGYSKASGLLCRLASREWTERNVFYRNVIPAIDWQFMIVPGIVAGAFISSLLSATFHPVLVPCRGAASFGADPFLRTGVVILGGILLALGARRAGGCTIGHSISGTLQLATPSMIAATCFFAGGIATAFLLFGIIGA